MGKPILSSQLLATCYQPDQIPPLKNPTILLMGRSNVGKSSLINSIFKKALAKVAKTPGKTVSVNLYRFADNLLVVDLPGFGYAKRSQEERQKWKPLVERLFECFEAPAHALVMVDSKRDIEEEEQELLESLIKRSISIEIILTKSDRLNQSERVLIERKAQQILEKYPAYLKLSYRLVSSKSGEGVESLRRDLLNYGKAYSVSN